jgi:hypothetical protein
MSLFKPKFITKFFDPPLRFGGGLVLNALGYHLLRILFFQVSYAVKKRKKLEGEREQKVLRKLMDKGIVVIPDFFSSEVFDEIRREYEAMNLPLVNERAPRIERSNVVGEGMKTLAPVLETHLARNAFINNVVSAAMRQTLTFMPNIAIEKSGFSAEDLAKESTDKADNLHFDVSYPTIKCFMYLNDVDERNAAFRFAPHSHKMTFARAWMEYRMSVPFWLWSKEDRQKITPEVDINWVKGQGLMLDSINGRANTLIIANTMGLHRRGDFSGTIPREMIFVNYRGLTDATILKQKIKSALNFLKRGGTSLQPPATPLKY